DAVMPEQDSFSSSGTPRSESDIGWICASIVAGLLSIHESRKRESDQLFVSADQPVKSRSADDPTEFLRRNVDADWSHCYPGRQDSQCIDQNLWPLGTM